MKPILLLFLLLLSVALHAAKPRPTGTPCDTIVLMDGRIILGRIFYEDRTLVKYNNCNEDIKTKNEISMFQVKEIRYGSDDHTQPFVEDRSRLNRNGVYLIVSLSVALLVGLIVLLLLLNG